MLIKTIDEIKEYAMVNVSNSLPKLKPHIRKVENKYIIPLLGQELYDLLHAAYQASPDVAMPAPLAALLPFVQSPIANLAYFIGLPSLTVNVTDVGVQVRNEEVAKAASQWMVDDQRRTVCDAGHEDLDTMLSFLERKVAEYEAWKNSEAYTLQRSLTIWTTQQFNEYILINNSRQTYVALRPIISRIENTRIAPNLGQFFTELKGRIKSGQLIAGDEEVLAVIRPAVAHLAMADGANELTMEVTNLGIMISSYKALSPNNRQKEAAMAAQLEQRRQDSAKKGEMYLKDLIDFMNKNASESLYQTYFNSTLYISPETTQEDTQPEDGCYMAI